MRVRLGGRPWHPNRRRCAPAPPRPFAGSNSGSRRVCTADEIQQQLDEVAEVLVQRAGEFVQGLLGAGPGRPKPKPKPQRRQETRDDK
jgi:hypothetical protein